MRNAFSAQVIGEVEIFRNDSLTLQLRLKKAIRDNSTFVSEFLDKNNQILGEQITADDLGLDDHTEIRVVKKALEVPAEVRHFMNLLFMQQIIEAENTVSQEFSEAVISRCRKNLCFRMGITGYGRELTELALGFIQLFSVGTNLSDGLIHWFSLIYAKHPELFSFESNSGLYQRISALVSSTSTAYPQGRVYACAKILANVLDHLESFYPSTVQRPLLIMSQFLESSSI